MNEIAFGLQAVGMVFEVIGAAIAARSFLTRATTLRLPLLLFAALFRMRHARGFTRAGPGSADRAARSEAMLDGLQGVALVCLGFVLQLSGFLIAGPQR